MIRSSTRVICDAGPIIHLDAQSVQPFESPFGRLTVLSDTEGLKALSKVEGRSAVSAQRKKDNRQLTPARRIRPPSAKGGLDRITFIPARLA